VSTFSVGDKVRVLRCDAVESQAREYVGKTGTIVDKDETSELPYKVAFDDQEKYLFKTEELCSEEAIALIQHVQEITIKAAGLQEDPCAKIEQPPPDLVNHPPHYTSGTVECIDCIEAAGLLEGFCLANTIKYIYRHKSKNGLEDLKKARWYLNRVIEYLEKKGKNNASI